MLIYLIFVSYIQGISINMDAVEGFSLLLLLSATLLYTASAAKDKELYCGGMFKFELSFLMR